MLVHTVDFLPVLQWTDYQGTEKKLKQVRKNKDAFLDELIQEYPNSSSRADHDVDERKTEHKSLIEVLMSLQQDEPETYNHEVVKGILGAVFMAGIETTRATMVAAVSLLVKNPEALIKLRDEIDFHVEVGRIISESDLPKLRIVLSQVMTFHPKWWDEPTKFKPERFDRESVMKGGKMDGFRWIPFGEGRRGCPGSGMDFRVTSLAIDGLIQCLEWKKADDYDKIIEEKGDEPSSRAMCRPRSVKKDILSQI
ncbi:hypothetical protein C5167_021324 [Papaver somniferum]|uniref:Cytochrome P450 n=1 Tax=Papaver somniferum TaxID=3469 RepID=A0A4Y7IXN0_PAPSO|nr:hypothetical protein C5167_021324 [Papaver somniferum]